MVHKYQQIVFGTLGELVKVDFGPPLHCLALCGDLHPLETEILEYFRVKPEDMVLDRTANSGSSGSISLEGMDSDPEDD
jgi:hypothetical protein